MLFDCVTLRSGLYCPALRLGRGEKVAPIPRDATALLVDKIMLYEICVHSELALNVSSAIHERQVGAH